MKIEPIPGIDGAVMTDTGITLVIGPDGTYVPADHQPRPIPGMDPYYATADGIIWRWWPKWGFKPMATDRHGRIKIRGHTYTVAAMVLTAFCGPAPYKHRAMHIDGDRHNNALYNLQWATNTQVLANTRHWRAFG